MDPNRYACTVLEEARDALKHLNWVTLPFGKRHLLTLIEELQTVVSRMEAGLEDKHDYQAIRNSLRDARDILAALHKEKDAIEGEIDDLQAKAEELKAVLEHLNGKVESMKGKADAAAYGGTDSVYAGIGVHPAHGQEASD